MEGQKGCQIHLGNRQCIGTGKALSWRLEHTEESNPIDEIASVRGPGGEGGAPCIERRRVCQPRNRSRSWLPDSEGGAANRVPDGNRWGGYRRGGTRYPRLRDQVAPSSPTLAQTQLQTHQPAATRPPTKPHLPPPT